MEVDQSTLVLGIVAFWIVGIALYFLTYFLLRLIALQRYAMNIIFVPSLVVSGVFYLSGWSLGQSIIPGLALAIGWTIGSIFTPSANRYD